MWQAGHVRDRLLALDRSLTVELVPMSTEGDRRKDVPLASFGGKGLFLKELEEAILDRRIDIAVHSMKDVTATLPEGLHIPAVLNRGDPHDAFVCNTHGSIEELPRGARVGTSSLRRRCQLAAMRPDLEIDNLRGNVSTRLEKLDSGRFDAIVLAAAGLERLGLQARICARIPPEQLLPAVGQGVIGIECRAGDCAVNEVVAQLDHADTNVCVSAERAVNERLAGSCHVPVAAYAGLSRDRHLTLRALVGTPDGRTVLRAEAAGPAGDAQRLGHQAADSLLGQGAAAILASLGDDGRP